MPYPYGQPDPTALAHATIDFSGAGDHVLVTPAANERVLLYQLFLVIDTATTLRFKSAGTNISGPLPLTANGTMALDNNHEPWLVTAPGEALILNQSGAGAVGGAFAYAIYAR